MKDTLILQRAIEEIGSRNFGVTEQILEVHQVEYIDGKPKVLRIDNDFKGGKAIVYFSIFKEKFYLKIYLNLRPEISVQWVEVESYHSVSFQVISETLSVDELLELTRLKPSESWNKGDKKKIGRLNHKYSCLRFQPNPGPGTFDDKMGMLLSFLEQDKAGVQRLLEFAKGFIQVSSCYHNGNTMLGGVYLNKEIISRMASLNLEIDFDNYAEGNKFKEPT